MCSFGILFKFVLLLIILFLKCTYYIIINSNFIISVLLFAYCYLLVIIFIAITIQVNYFIKMFNGRYITIF